MSGGVIAINYGVLVAVVIGLVEAAKRIGVPEKFAPLVSLILGLGLSFLGFVANPDLASTIIGGIIIGLSAVGLYSGTKNVIEGFKDNE
jgi:hypothetical protein